MFYDGVQVAWHKGNGIAQTVFTCLYCTTAL